MFKHCLLFILEKDENDVIYSGQHYLLHFVVLNIFMQNSPKWYYLFACPFSSIFVPKINKHIAYNSHTFLVKNSKSSNY